MKSFYKLYTEQHDRNWEHWLGGDYATLYFWFNDYATGTRPHQIWQAWLPGPMVVETNIQDTQSWRVHFLMTLGQYQLHYDRYTINTYTRKTTLSGMGINDDSSYMPQVNQSIAMTKEIEPLVKDRSLNNQLRQFAPAIVSGEMPMEALGDLFEERGYERLAYMARTKIHQVPFHDMWHNTDLNTRHIEQNYQDWLKQFMEILLPGDK